MSAPFTVAELDADRRDRDRLREERPEGFPLQRWTVSQAASELGMTVGQVRKLCRSGELAAERWIGNQWAIPAGAIGDYQGARRQKREDEERAELVDRISALEEKVAALRLTLWAAAGLIVARTK